MQAASRQIEQRLRLPARSRGAPRRGAALIIALIALLLVGVLGAELARSAVLQHQQVQHEEWQIQAEWLAESALDRAATMIEADSAYRGETWLPVRGESRAPLGRVLIEITESAEEGLAVRVVADVPDTGESRARVSRERTFPAAATETDESE